MKLKERFRRWLLDGQDSREESNRVPTSSYDSGSKIGPMTSSAARKAELSGGMTFTLYSASGGQVMQFRAYNPTKDHWDERLYLVPDGEDFSQRVAEIVTLEAIRQ